VPDFVIFSGDAKNPCRDGKNLSSTPFASLSRYGGILCNSFDSNYFRVNRKREMKFTSRLSSISNHRLLISFFIFVSTISLLFSSQLGFSAETRKSINPAEQLFSSQRAYYLYQRSIEFSDRMIVREAFLKWLYDGINSEVIKRRKEDLSSTLRTLSPPELSNLKEKSYSLPQNWQKMSPGEKYVFWEESVLSEYNRKYLEARLIKDALIRNAKPDQMKRMFKRDLTEAFYVYRDEDFQLASIYLDELIHNYSYSNMSDLIFYRGESYFALKLYDRAFRDYEVTVERSDDRALRLKALAKMLIISGDIGRLQQAIELWEDYQRDSRDKDEDYWRIADMTARYLYSGGELAAAKEVFDQIPESMPFYGLSLLRAADCALRQFQLDEAEKRYLPLIKGRSGGKNVSNEIQDEARLKLGYVDFLRGDYDLAFVNFNSLREEEGKLYEKAMIASCWSLYKLDAYKQAVKLSDQFLRDYPVSDHKYEALCIIGYCKEKLDQFDPAVETYTKVMSAVDERKEFRDLTYEKTDIQLLLDEIKRLEPIIFMQGRADLFDDYRDLRYKATVMLDRARLAEGIKASPMLLNLMEEQREIYRIMTEQTSLKKKILKENEIDFYYEYEDIIFSLMDMSTDVDLAIQHHLDHEKEVIQVEEQRVSNAMQRDSLLLDLRYEWKATDKALADARSYLINPRGIDSETLAELAGLERELVDIQDQMVYARKELGDEDIEARIAKSDLDAWSDFAYQRYTYGGLKFENLAEQQKRLGQIDEYIQQINQLLADKRYEEVDTSTFLAEMMPTSPEGVDAYYAPPIPLWDAETSTFSDYAKKKAMERAAEEIEDAPSDPEEPSEMDESPPTDASPSAEEMTPPDEGVSQPQPEEGGVEEPEAEMSEPTEEEMPTQDEPSGEADVPTDEEAVSEPEDDAETVPVEEVTDEPSGDLPPEEAGEEVPDTLKKKNDDPQPAGSDDN